MPDVNCSFFQTVIYVEGITVGKQMKNVKERKTNQVGEMNIVTRDHSQW